MNEAELQVHNSILLIRNTLQANVDNVNDNDEIRFCIETLSNQLLKVVGRRIIKESLKNKHG